MLTTTRHRHGALALALATCTAAFALSPQPAHTDHASAPPHAHAGELAAGHVGTLDAGTPAVFWETPYLACEGEPYAGGVSASKSCDGVAPWVWTVTVADGADALWVDWDQPYRQDDYRLSVSGPGASASQSSHNTYTEGVRIAAPEAGTWVVELQPNRTDGAKVRLRAGLVNGRQPIFASGLPNLRVTPPFEFGFAAPVNPLNSVFLAGDDQNPPASINGQTVNSCAADEVQEAIDPTRQDEPKLITRCLRLTTGPHNVGTGHLDLRFPILDRARNDRDRLVEMTQVIRNPDATITERDAGTYEYHVSHGHYHYLDILFYEAFRIVDEATGELERIGRGNKSGFCPDDQGYGEWTTFDQRPIGELASTQPGGGCFAINGNGAMGLTAGWGDFYRWQRSGQYIDFTGVGDGTYVVRATVDILDNVLETDETDNASYALIEVTGDEVEILERGYGASPFDEDKVIATDHRDR